MAANVPEPMQTGAPTQNAAGGVANGGNTTTSTEFGKVMTLLPVNPDEGKTQRCTFKKRQHFYIKIKRSSDTPSIAWYSDDSQTANVHNGWFVMPMQSSGMYMDNAELAKLFSYSSKFRVLGAGFSMSNFTMMTATASAAVGLTQQFGGIGWESVVMGSKELGPHYIGELGDNRINGSTYDSIAQYFNEPHKHEEFTFRLAQTAQSAYAEMTSATDGRMVGAVHNLSAHSKYGMGKPPVTELMIRPPHKHWIQVGPVRPTTTLLRHPGAVGTAPRISVNQIATLPVWGLNNSLNAEKAKLDGVWAINGAKSTIIMGSKDATNRGFNHFRIFTPNAAPTVKFSFTASGYSADNKNITPPGQEGDGTPMDMPVYCFRPVVPPTIDGSDPNLIALFTVETAMMVEYQGMLETNDLLSRYDNIHLTMGAADASPAIRNPDDFQTGDAGYLYANSVNQQGGHNAWMGGAKETNPNDVNSIISARGLSDVPFSAIPGGNIYMATMGWDGNALVGAHGSRDANVRQSTLFGTTAGAALFGNTNIWNGA